MNKSFKELKLDKEKIPLKGISLVEAGAGTGKTFSITKIIIEAVLDNIELNRILVVTFTEAATKELRSRIRNELYLFNQYLKNINSADKAPDFYEEIIGFFTEKKSDIIKYRKKIQNALLSVDRAQIFTIHAFCKKMLTENAFESGQTFDSELLTDNSEILQTIKEDFWRENFIHLPEVILDLIKSINLDKIEEIIRHYIKNGDKQLVNTTKESFQELLNDVLTTLSPAVDKLNNCNLDDLMKQMSSYFSKHCASLNKPLGKKYYEETIRSTIENLKSKNYDIETLKVLDFEFIQETVSKNAQKKNYKLEKPDFAKIGAGIFRATEKLKNLKTALIPEIFSYTEKKLIEFKLNRNSLTFDDLITNLYDALKNEQKSSSKPLTSLIRSKYDLALVDEFQDTDTKQYFIFKTLFGNDRSKGFFMIGDPKQSIYRFRGADVFSYITAKNEADNNFTLRKNFRSEPKVVHAVNALFTFKDYLIQEKKKNQQLEKSEEKSEKNNEKTSPEESSDIFVYGGDESFEGIQYIKAEPGLKNGRKLVIHDPGNNAPLIMQIVPPSSAGYSDEYAAAMYTGNEIAKILNMNRTSAYFLEKDGSHSPVRPKDFAVLVKTHRQAKFVKQVMTRLKIPAVIQNTDKIFESEQAKEIQLWLKSVVTPSEKNIRKLFVTDLFRKSFKEIDEIDTKDFTSLIETFTSMAKYWSNNGFFASFTAFLDKFNLVPKILKQPNGERIIANYFQLRDLLHQYEMQNIFSPERTLAYLTDKIHHPEGDEFIEELESDKEAVTIMTVHKSKGLEFPIVFCPYFWQQEIAKGQTNALCIPFCEFEKGKPVHKLDIGADTDLQKKHKMVARKENLAEMVRLLYVAVTRAANQIYLPLLPVNYLQASVFAWIFTVFDTSYIKNATSKDPECVSEVLESLNKLEADNPELVRVNQVDSIPFRKEYHPDQINTNTTMYCEKLNPAKLKAAWQVSSFSGLKSSHKYEHDSLEKGTGFFQLPTGKKFGSVIHKIFENYYTHGDKIFTELYPRKFFFENLLFSNDYFRTPDTQLNQQRIELAEQMIRNCINISFPLNNENIRLSELVQAIPEFSFNFKVNTISPALFADSFRKFPDFFSDSFSENIADLGFEMKNGYIHGEIDLIFRTPDGKYFVLDWKTNNLGTSEECYSPVNIRKNMEKHLYAFQAYIYSTALHIYLKTYMQDYNYDKHFGGYVYVYTRGVDNKGNGVYAAKPPQKMILNTTSELCGI